LILVPFLVGLVVGGESEGGKRRVIVVTVIVTLVCWFSRYLFAYSEARK
jgi:hypothetical protein